MQDFVIILRVVKEVAMKAKILIFIALLSICSVYSQEIPIRKANRIEFDDLHIKTSDNQTIIFWKEYVNSRNDIAVQKFNHLAEEQWDSPTYFGITGSDNFPVAVVRSSDQANILLWKTDEFPYRRLYLAKFDDNGQSLWPSAPLLVFGSNDAIPTISMTANSAGGVFIVYTADYTSNTIKGFNIDGNGNQLWNQNGQLLASFNSEVQVRAVHPDGEGGMIVNCLLRTMDWTNATHLIRFSSTAEIVGSNPLIPEGAFSMLLKHITPTTDGNFLLSSASLYTDPTLYMQKIDNLGNPVGTLYSYPFPNSQTCRELTLRASPDGGVIAAWRHLEDEILSSRCQSFDTNLLPLWTPNGVILDEPSYHYYDLVLEPDASGGAWLHSYGSIFYLNATGEATLEQEGINLSNAYTPRVLLSARSNSLSAIWREESNRSISLRKQVVSTDGSIHYPVGGAPIVSSLAGFAIGSSNYVLGDKYLCLWSDSRIGNKDTKLLYQILDDTGQIYLENDGRELNPDSDSTETLYQTAVIGGNKLAILYRVWSEGLVYRLQIIDENGNRLIPGLGLELGTPGMFTEIKMDSYGNDLYFGWIEESDGYKLVGQMVSNQQIQWGEDGIVLLEFPQNSYCFLSDLRGRYYVFTMENYNTSRYEAKTLLVEPNGEISPGWDPQGQYLVDSNTFDYQFCFDTELLEEDLIAVLHTYQGVNTVSVAQRMNPSGQRLWSDTGVLIPGASWHQSLSKIWIDEQINLLHLTGFGPYMLRYQRISSDGDIQWPGSGAEIAPSPGFTNSYVITGFDDGVKVAIYEKDGAQETYYGHYFDLGLKYISPDGYPAFENPLLCSAPYDQRYISAASMGHNALISWTDNRAGVYSEDYAYSSIYARLITSEPIPNIDPVLPPQARVILNQNYPNPFNPETTLSFSLDKATRARLRIYNNRGQLVKTLLATDLSTGTHHAVWNGQDEQGHSVSSGIYFYKLEAAGRSQTRKMLLLK